MPAVLNHIVVCLQIVEVEIDGIFNNASVSESSHHSSDLPCAGKLLGAVPSWSDSLLVGPLNSKWVASSTGRSSASSTDQSSSTNICCAATKPEPSADHTLTGLECDCAGDCDLYGRVREVEESASAVSCATDGISTVDRVQPGLTSVAKTAAGESNELFSVISPALTRDRDASLRHRVPVKEEPRSPVSNSTGTLSPTMDDVQLGLTSVAEVTSGKSEESFSIIDTLPTPNIGGCLHHRVRVKDEPVSPVSTTTHCVLPSICDGLIGFSGCLETNTDELKGLSSEYAVSRPYCSSNVLATNSASCILSVKDDALAEWPVCAETNSAEFEFTSSASRPASNCDHNVLVTCAVSSAVDKVLRNVAVYSEADACGLEVDLDEAKTSVNCDVAVNKDGVVNIVPATLPCCTSEVASLPLNSAVVKLANCSSHSTSASVSDVKTPPPLKLVKFGGSSGRAPQAMMVPVQSSSAANFTESPTNCARSATSLVHPTKSALVTLGERDKLLTVCPVGGSTFASVNGYATPLPAVQPCVTAASLFDTPKSRTVLNSAAPTNSLLTVSLPSSVLNTSAVAHGGSAKTRVVLSSQQCQQVRLISDKLRSAGVLRSNTVIKPRPLVPLSSTNSPARSLPHITSVMPAVSSGLTPSQNTISPVNSVGRSTLRTTSKQLTSSSTPTLYVVGGNSGGVSSDSSAVMEVVLVQVPRTAVQRVGCGVSVQGDERRPISSSAVVLPRSGVGALSNSIRVSSSSGSSQVSVLCSHSLFRVTKPNSMSRSAVSLLRPQTKSSMLEPRAKAPPTASNSNFIATKIGNRTVIVDVGNLSTSSTVAKSSVTAETSSIQPKDMAVPKSEFTQLNTSSVCEDVSVQSSVSSAVTTELAESYTPVLRYFAAYCFCIHVHLLQW